MRLDSYQELAATAAAQDGVFSRADARAAGFRKHHIDRYVGQLWSVIYDSVYRIEGAPTTWHSELRAATLAAGSGSAVSHRAAAAIHALPGGRDDFVEITCVRWKRTVRTDLIVHESRRLDPDDIQLVDGIPVTCPERTILDLAWHFPRTKYLELVVQAARRKRLVTYESTKAVFERHARRGLRGVSALREVLEQWDPESRPTESEMETRLLQTLRDHELPEPTVQFDVCEPDGRLVARTDAAYPFARIAIEYDSKQEHSDEFQLARDAKRRNALQAAGFVVLSARHRDLAAGGTEICAQISRILRRNSELA